MSLFEMRHSCKLTAEGATVIGLVFAKTVVKRERESLRVYLFLTPFVQLSLINYLISR